MKTKIAIILIFLTNLLIVGQSLKLNIELEKNSFLLNEQITMLVRIDNKTESNQIYSVNLFSHNLKVMITEENGDIIQNRIFFSEVSVKNTILSSGESEFLYYDLLPFNCITNLEDKTFGFYLGHIKPGKYKLVCSYDFKGSIGTITSNILEFEVVFPQNSKYKKQLEQYTDLMMNSKKTSYDEFTNRINSIIKLAPNSPYSILAKNRLIEKSEIWGEKKQAKKLMEEMCVDHPNSFVPLKYIMENEDIQDAILDKKSDKKLKLEEYARMIKKFRKN